MCWVIKMSQTNTRANTKGISVQEVDVTPSTWTHNYDDYSMLYLQLLISMDSKVLGARGFP